MPVAVDLDGVRLEGLALAGDGLSLLDNNRIVEQVSAYEYVVVLLVAVVNFRLVILEVELNSRTSGVALHVQQNRLVGNGSAVNSGELSKGLVVNEDSVNLLIVVVGYNGDLHIVVLDRRDLRLDISCSVLNLGRVDNNIAVSIYADGVDDHAIVVNLVLNVVNLELSLAGNGVQVRSQSSDVYIVVIGSVNAVNLVLILVHNLNVHAEEIGVIVLMSTNLIREFLEYSVPRTVCFSSALTTRASEAPVPSRPTLPEAIRTPVAYFRPMYFSPMVWLSSPRTLTFV